MEEKRKKASPEEHISTVRDAPPPYAYADQFPSAYPRRSGSAPEVIDQQLPPVQASYPKAEPYQPTQQSDPQKHPQGNDQPPGYGAPVVTQPDQVELV